MRAIIPLSMAITRRTFLATSTAAAAAQLTPAPKRPNLVFILADDLGYGDLPAWGARTGISTPNIDAIIKNGIRFTRAYANAPECTPTRASFLTGRYPHRVGGLECAIGVGNAGRYDDAEWLAARGELGLPTSETSIARMLKDAGYDTCLSGKWHLGYDLAKFGPLRHGFDEFFGITGGNSDYFTHREPSGDPVLVHNETHVDRKGYLTTLIADHAVGWLQRRTPDRPFFHYIAFNAPHTPTQGPADEDRPVNSENWERGDSATYGKMIESLDTAIGMIVAQIRAMGALENTLLVFTSDNGATRIGSNAPLRGAKSQTWEGGIRVPCAVQWPGRIPSGRTSKQVLATMDWTATFLAAARVKPSATRPPDGIDLLPHLTATSAPPVHRTLFFRYRRGQAHRFAVLDGDMKYVRDNDQEYLFDLATDESEQRDLSARRPAELQSLKAKLAAWEKQVEAPRLRAWRASQR